MSWVSLHVSQDVEVRLALALELVVREKELAKLQKKINQQVQLL